MTALAKEYSVKLLISTVAYNRMVPPFRAKDNSYGLCKEIYQNREFEKAKVCLEDALDSDLQPHRATKTSNAIVREIANTGLAPLIDTDEAIVDAALDRIPGFDLFSDHCHLNNKGKTILIELFYEKINEILN